MFLLFWPLLGALIGFYAAQKKGFSAVGGVIGGLLLGPFAFLLFFVSGIMSANEQQRKCPFCAEWIRPEATVCKHCHKDVPPLTAGAQPRRGMSVIVKGALLFAAAFFGLVAYVSISNGVSPVASSVTMAKFSRLQTGMTYQQVVDVIGAPGVELSRSQIAGISTVMYAWKNPNGSNMNAMFQNGEMVNKAQFGLR